MADGGMGDLDEAVLVVGNVDVVIAKAAKPVGGLEAAQGHDGAAPLARDEVTGVKALSEHARRVFATIEPEALLASADRVRFERRGDDFLVRIPLPGVDRSHLDVVKIDDQLAITVGGRRRSLALPRRIAPLSLVGARVEGASLVVRFARGAAQAV